MRARPLLCALTVTAVAAAPVMRASAAPRAADGDDDDSADDPEDGSDVLPPPPAQPAPHAPTSPRAALIAEANRELAAVRETRYTHRTHIDETAGVFDYDCSGFVGYALATAAPAAWKPIAALARRPVARDFEQFLAAPTGPWTAVKRAIDLAPGDIIAWLEPRENHSRNTGHVMIVAAAPQRSERRDRPNEVVVAVIDSSHSGHGSADARVRDHRGGLGTGALVLIVDEDGRAIGYRWSTARASIAYRSAIALGHLP